MVMSTNTAAAPGGWTVEIVRLPLPAAPIAEGAGDGGVILSQPRWFPTLEAAMPHARELAQKGYGLQMTGPEGQDWDHQQILAYLDGQAAKRSALRPEDGAKFYGRVEPSDEGRFRASCGARLDYLSGVMEEAPDYFMCRSHEEGVAWIEQMAARRGFTKWFDESPRS